MGVVNTNEWLQQYCQSIKKAKTREQQFKTQCDILIRPMIEQNVFKEPPHPVELHQYLLGQGLVHPDSDIVQTIETFGKKKVWEVIESQFRFLKKKWQGPDVHIFVFPVEERNEMIMKHLGKKMGIGFSDKMILFLSPTVTKKEIEALVTHEYHHVCRLKIEKEESELTLLDSLLIEGLAEKAVEEELGKEMLAIWTSMYTSDVLDYWWDVVFKERLTIKGRKNHHPFLFGHRGMGWPQWIGYALGYAIVDESTKRNEKNTIELLSMPAKAIVKNTSFEIET
ncbi:DUF2268 domain-containing protein [Alkalihalobacillus sp. LMS39]|uniref:DUF2268 domain-containing protein n=1 Tax=Alkalihalobacillus sp. LMS39 TaxID=2924032 RepID=UPI001FB2BFF3|nr:DUF2268 domain-containing protein [Alkalihalobacillus sp. LMS39]UOE93164.1 DUF2268 domain-containing putative Zn-dependent protease [Alkalihalobacillus sp. LMS39]